MTQDSYNRMAIIEVLCGYQWLQVIVKFTSAMSNILNQLFQKMQHNTLWYIKDVPLYFGLQLASFLADFYTVCTRKECCKIYLLNCMMMPYLPHTAVFSLSSYFARNNNTTLQWSEMLSFEDKILIKKLCESTRFSARRLVKEDEHWMPYCKRCAQPFQSNVLQDCLTLHIGYCSRLCKCYV